MIEYTNVSLGGDPEFFIAKKKKLTGKMEIISADKFLPPKRNKGRSDGGHYFFDGVQAEINPRYYSCREILIYNIASCLNSVWRKCTKESKNIYFLPLASVDIKKDTIKDTDRECRRFGCSPDFNIYTEKSPKYPDGEKHLIRYAGGHIHLGFNNITAMDYFKNPTHLINLIKMLDSTIGIMSVALSPDIEEKLRRKYYGKAGTYRLPNHGLEYRVLSSFWLASPIMVSLVYTIARTALTITMRKPTIRKEYIKSISLEEVRDIIDNINKEKAIEFYHEKIVPLIKETKIRASLLGDKNIKS